jgi:hypothetical protein
LQPPDVHAAGRGLEQLDGVLSQRAAWDNPSLITAFVRGRQLATSGGAGAVKLTQFARHRANGFYPSSGLLTPIPDLCITCA